MTLGLTHDRWEKLGERKWKVIPSKGTFTRSQRFKWSWSVEGTSGLMTRT